MTKRIFLEIKSVKYYKGQILQGEMNSESRVKTNIICE